MMLAIEVGMSTTANMTTKKVTAVPARLEPFGDVGWTVFCFKSAGAAAAWVVANPQAAMPCWRRFDVVGGELVLAR